MIFKVNSQFLLYKTHLITGSSNITSNDNLADKQPFTAEKTVDFLEFPLYSTNITPLEHYPILSSLLQKKCQTNAVHVDQVRGNMKDS